MRGYPVVMALCAVILFGATLGASDKAPEAIVKNMQAINLASIDLRESVDSKDLAAVAKIAASLRTLFKTTLAFWEKQKVADAVMQARSAVKATSDVAAAAKAHDENGVGAAHRALLAACNACHMAHRVRTKDGQYEVE